MDPITPWLGGVPFPEAASGMSTPTWQQPTGAPAGLMPVAPGVQQAQCAALLQRLEAWLEATVPQVPQLARLIPATVLAVQQYAAGQYQNSLTQAYGVVRTLDQVRAMHPGLPPL
jgi:hypothetical protein